MSHEVAIVTGSSSGLGRELALRLTANGTQVVGVSRSGGPDDDFAPETFVSVSEDVSDERTVDSAFAEADKWGGASLLVQCAGVGVFGDPGRYSREDVDTVLAGNLIGTMLFADRAFHLFTERGAGTIVNVISTAAHAARPKETIYTAAKWGARGYTEALRAAAKGTQVRVVGAYPGGMQTPFWSNAHGADSDGSGFADPAEIADAILAAIQLRPSSYVTDLLLNRI